MFLLMQYFEKAVSSVIKIYNNLRNTEDFTSFA